MDKDIRENFVNAMARSVQERRYSLTEALRAAYDAGLAAAQKWHKASEKPKEDGLYQVTFLNQYPGAKPFSHYCVWHKSGGWGVANVLAWRELPPPYEEAQQ